MMKFAYLIMAHKNLPQLLTLIKLLDYENNDLYIHVDKKSQNINLKMLKNQTKYAKVYIFSEIKVYWADISQTKCEFYLLSQAVKKGYDYYHLLSGSDLPIKRHEEIESWFIKNNGKEFIHFESYELCERAQKYRFFNGLIIRTNNIKVKQKLKSLERKSLDLQDKLKVKRKYYCGANWFSITHELATELVKRRKKLLKSVRYTISSDELIIQTYLMAHGWKNEIYKFSPGNEDNYEANLRNIDWYRGGPYVWRKEDFEELISGPYLFARKFDEQIDGQIIKMIAQHVGGENV